MSYFPYPTPPLRSGVICLRGDGMAERPEMTQEEIDEYLGSEDANAELAGMGPGDRDGEDYEDGDGGEQVRA